MRTRQPGITRCVNLKGLTPCLALLFVAVPAQAAPFGELPYRGVPTAAVCVRATGVPGELIRWSRGGFTCKASSAGLRCSNRSGHGFFLSRTSQRVF